LFLYMYVRKEAVLSSQIEGTKSTLSDLLRFETEAQEGEPIDDDDDDRGHVRLYLSRGQAAAFCDHADGVVEAGRPPCPWCANPIDPDGHDCPRMN